MQIELLLLILSVLFFASILAGKAGSRFGVSALLIFLSVEMLFGSDRPGLNLTNTTLNSTSPARQSAGRFYCCRRGQ